MLKRDKNGFLRILEESGFNLHQFEAFEEDRDDIPAFVIRLNETPLEFWTRNDPSRYTQYDRAYTEFGPDYPATDYWPRNNWTDDIDDVYNEFSEWLTNHVQLYLEELTAPDLWSQVEYGHAALGMLTTKDDDFRMFTTEEKADIINAIQEFRFKILGTFQPTENEIAVIDNKLNYLIEATDRLNKFDWKSIFVSTLIGIATTMSLDISAGQNFYSFARRIFSEALRLLHKI